MIQHSVPATLKTEWKVEGSLTAVQAALTTAKDADTVNKLAAAGILIIQPEYASEAFEMRYVTDDDADANVLNLYAMAGDNDYYTLIATITLTGGTQIAPGTSKVFCDTAVVSVGVWPSTITHLSATTNNIASVFLKTHGYSNFLVIATTLDNTLTVHSRKMTV